MYIGVIYALNLFTILRAQEITPKFSKITHSYLGHSSDVYLTKYEPEIYDKISKVLNGQTINSVSSWADSIKRTKEYSWTRTLHYIDIMECRKGVYDKSVIEHYCENSCIVSALNSFVEELKSRSQSNICSNNFRILGNETRLSDEDLLKFIIHFMEDFVQPMHLLGYERGGNSLRLQVKMPEGNIRRTNLHQLWDSLVPEYYTKMFNPSFDFNVDKPIDYSKFVEEHLNKNIHIGCLIYPDEVTIVFEEYFNKEYLDILFKNYHELSVGTFKYIFE
jgi:hypothetical protein